MTFVDERVAPSGDSNKRHRSNGHRVRGRLRLNPIAAIRRRRHRSADRWLARAHRRRRLPLMLVPLAIVLVIGVVWSVWFSSILAVQQVRVMGLTKESAVAGVGQVEAAADISLTTPLIEVQTEAARKRVAELPWVESVDVYRSWPNAIVIDVRERIPVAVVEEGDERRGVDASGVAFDPPGGLWLTDPVIRGGEAAVPTAVAVVASLPEEIARRVRLVQAVSPDDIRLQLGNNAIVRWGNAEEADFKAQVLLALLPRRAQAYDVSAPQLPTTFGEKGPRD